jgi:hypothetical protein
MEVRTRILKIGSGCCKYPKDDENILFNGIRMTRLQRGRRGVCPEDKGLELDTLDGF